MAEKTVAYTTSAKRLQDAECVRGINQELKA